MKSQSVTIIAALYIWLYSMKYTKDHVRALKGAFIQIPMKSASRSPYSVRNPATVKRAANTTREIAEIWSKS